MAGQPGTGLLGINAEDLTQPGAGGDRGGEGTAKDQLVAAHPFLLQGDAGRSLKLQDGPHQHHGETVPDCDRVRPREVQDGMDAKGIEPSGQPRRDSPEFDHGQAGHELLLLRGGHGLPVADAVERRVVFGPLVGQLGQRLGAGDANADGNTDVPAHRCLHGVAHPMELLRGAADAQERLINAVDLQPGRGAAEELHHPCADVPIQLVVAGQRDEPPFLGPRRELEPGLAEGDPEGLGLGGTGDRTAVIIGQHHERTALQGRVEGAFGAGIEAVHVHQGDAALAGGSARHDAGSGSRHPR